MKASTACFHSFRCPSTCISWTFLPDWSRAGRGTLSVGRLGRLDDFDLALRKYKGGDVVNVTVIRGGKRKAMKITLAKPR